MNQTEIRQFEVDGYGTEPSIDVTPDGTVHVAYMCREINGVEGIRLRSPDQPAPRSLSHTQPGHHGWPTVTTSINGTVAVVWASIGSSRDEESRLLLWRSDRDEVETLLQAPVVRWPTATWADGWIWAACAVSGPRHHIALVGVGPDGRSVRRVLDPSPIHLRARPAIAHLDHRVAVAWEAHGHGAVQIHGSLGREVVTLVDDGGFAQAPTWARRAAGGLWLGWQTDRPTPATPTLARWVRVASVTPDLQEVQHLPALPGMSLDSDGEDQSLEFPTLIETADGLLWVVARASHNFRVQRFTPDGWEHAEPLDPVLWGCRGTRIGAIPEGPSSITVAVHGRRGLALHTLRGGTPKPVQGLMPHGRPRWGETRAWFGDIHFHSAASDGIGTAEEAYLRCRDRYRDDFACLTDHDAFIGRRVTETVWRSLVETAEAFNRPDDGFVTLIGIEYTGVRYPGPGHKCLYFDGPEAALVCRWDGLEDPADLLARLRDLGGIAVPHHVGWLGGDPDHHDSTVQPVWEICSTHGQYEAETTDPDAPTLGYREGADEHREALRDHFIRRRLEAGQVFGFVGGSDGHGLLWHHGVGRKADSHRTGLTGVWLPRLSRGGIMSAIRERQTFATSGGKIALGFRADGHLMGSTLPKSPTVLDVTWSAGGPLSLCVFAPDDDGKTRAIFKGEPAERITLDRPLPSHGFLYLRLTETETGETAWASPVFW